MSNAMRGAVRLLDVLAAREGWDLIDGGEVWPVREWAAEWTAGAGEEDRGPVVAVCDGEDGRRAVVALDEGGRPVELVGVLAREG